MRCVVAEPELPSLRKLKCVVQNKWNGYRKSNKCRNHYDKITLYKVIMETNK